jgi:hypothetical protein
MSAGEFPFQTDFQFVNQWASDDNPGTLFMEM